jgi:hypothetical protein
LFCIEQLLASVIVTVPAVNAMVLPKFESDWYSRNGLEILFHLAVTVAEPVALPAQLTS